MVEISHFGYVYGTSKGLSCYHFTLTPRSNRTTSRGWPVTPTQMRSSRDDIGRTGKAAAVGCTIHGETHESFERELGIPQMLAWLEDVIFEGLPNRLAKNWPERFLSSIAPGRDLSPVGWQFLHWLLTESGLAEFDHVLTKVAVTRCAETLVPLIDRQPINASAAEHAASAARAAMHTVSHIDVQPDVVAWSAESAALAAESAALSGIDPPRVQSAR